MRKKDPAKKNLRVFLLETLKNYIISEKSLPLYDHNQGIFSNFRKWAGIPLPSPFSPLVTRLVFCRKVIVKYFAELTGEHPHQSLLLSKVAGNTF